MVERRVCTFCGNEIEPGTGIMFVRRDGTIYRYCSRKCKKNHIDLRRVPRRVRWTRQFAALKAAGKSKEARAVPKEEEQVVIEEAEGEEEDSATEPKEESA
ncbi:MAG: 50S ribosomal protein L24e [Candidatus Thermoplasmatota archaeon]